ncbi:MAG TPA: CoA transferase [Alphaproteobacteria bacterium]|jgi:crotonobetainyl-CoA:carnitine CoA-transferase CaiB-like acyl-CoA transferase|nr:CoA transferase [Alphaproteobacteria bacterium]MDP7164319.1 CoA transferase [Alphaproteobacteria bacterium]MDP7427641.1 CoA transferase [Alphaproteobacteria bacterium]HJM48996.1 CoA transferase [Alphaproteobacteria bacterium]
MPGPLDGIRVLDFSAVISGPYATMILADQGADVIKIEPPGTGDFTRAAGNQSGGLSATFLNNNRNKRSLVINLKSPAGVEVVKRLASQCDVLVQNFRPGVVEHLGIGEEAIRGVAPEIVYVSISGFGEVGPYAQKPVYDPIVQALSGLASVQGGSDQNRPRLVRTILPDKLTAVTAAQAITAALLSRARSGQGQHVRLSMLDAVVAFLWSSDMGGQTYVGKSVSQQRAASFIDLIYETKDGYMSVAVMTDAQWAALCQALGRPEWLEDERFATTELRDLNIDARLELIQSELGRRSTAEWLERFETAGVPCAPVLTRNQVIAHPQIVAGGIIFENDHPQAGRLRQSRNAARFSVSSPEYRQGAPKLGQHSDEILAEAGFAPAEIADLRAAGVVGG